MQSSNPFGFVTLSTIIHSGFVLGLLMVPHLTPLAEGAGGSTTVEFESYSPTPTAPDTAETFTESAAAPTAEPEPVAPPPPPEPQEAKPVTKTIQEEVKAPVVIKKTAVKKVAPAPKPLKFKNTTAVKETPKIVPAPESLTPTEDTAEEGELPAAAAESSDANEAWSKEDTAASEVPESTASATDADATATETSESDEEPLAAPAAAAAPSTAMADQSPTLETPASAGGAPTNDSESSKARNAGPIGGPPAGPIRSYEELRQIPGNVPPKYPPPARMQRQQGRITLRYYVTADGRVSNMSLIQSSGYPMLDQEALSAVARYKYVPGQEGWTVHPVNFSLRGPEEGAGGRLRTSRR